MNKGLFISALTLLTFANAAYAAPATQSLSPYDVVVPSLNGDPATSARVSGQLYYDVSTGLFKGIDGSGAVKPFLTNNQWQTSGTYLYTTGGKVGIGGVPGGTGMYTLDVQTGANGSDAIIVRTSTSGSAGAVVIKPEFASSGMANIQGTNSGLSYAAALSINAEGGDTVIGTSSYKTKLIGGVQMSSFGAGTATFDSSGNISSSSDERLKTDIQPFQTGLAALSKINPIRYKWNSISGMETQHDYVGFSAQNVQAALPEGVGVNNKGYLSLQERAIIATLVNAVKELEAEVKQLKAEHKK